MNWAEAPIIPTRSALLRSAMTLSKEWQALIGPRPDIHAGRRSRRGDCSLIPKNYLSELLFARKKSHKEPFGTREDGPGNCDTQYCEKGSSKNKSFKSLPFSTLT